MELDARYLTVGIFIFPPARCASEPSVLQRAASDLQRPNLTEATTGGGEDVSTSKFVSETIRRHICEQKGAIFDVCSPVKCRLII